MDYYFCNATMRVQTCSQSTNICCLVCKDKDECFIRSRNHSLKPCRKELFDEDEVCEFKI